VMSRKMKMLAVQKHRAQENQRRQYLTQAQAEALRLACACCRIWCGSSHPLSMPRGPVRRLHEQPVEVLPFEWLALHSATSMNLA
jgi:hypothetical protein